MPTPQGRDFVAAAPIPATMPAIPSVLYAPVKPGPRPAVQVSAVLGVAPLPAGPPAIWPGMLSPPARGR